MDLFKDLFNVANGIRSGVQDVPSFLGDVLKGDVHGMATDGRKLIGDVGDVLDGVGGLGVSMGKVSARYAGAVGKLADSPILSAAQLAIEAEKATTGSGDPEDGNGYQESARRLEECVETLIDAEPRADRWDGIASRTYDEANKTHRRQTSAAQDADSKIGAILATEADQVSRTRQTLDDTSQYLYDYGLATAVVSFIPGANIAKMIADAAAASAALATTNTTMLILANNALENASRVREHLSKYNDTVEAAARDAPSDVGPDMPFVDPRTDQADLPGRIQPGAEHTTPSPEEPIEYGPPATPYDDPSSSLAPPTPTPSPP
ncbi:MAG: EspA/EspE family type VII secretion system effector [Mycobacterium sp.]